MTTLTSTAGRELRWIRPALFKQEYELRSGETVVAELKLANALGRTATAMSGDGSWIFERTGFLQSRLHVRDAATLVEIASLSENRLKRSQQVVLPDGSQYVIRFDFFGTEYTLETASGEILAFTKRRGFFRVIWATEIRYRAKTHSELPWLVLLMWYYILIRRRRGRAH